MKLTYTGPLDTLSLVDGEGETIFEEIMHPGQDYELPDHPTVEIWRARELLVEPDPDAADEAPPEDDTSRVAQVARKVRQQRTPGDGDTQPQE